MSPLATLAWGRLRSLRHRLATLGRESRLKVAFVSLGAVGLWLGVYFAARFGFALFRDLGADALGPGIEITVADLVMSRLLSLFALALLVMLFFSNLAVSFAALYRAPEVAFLLRAPLPIASLFLSRLVECVSLSSWASAYLGSPILLAYGLESGVAPAFYLALGAFFVPFVVLPASAAALLVLAVTPLLARLRRGVGIALGGLAILGVYLVFRQRLRLPDLSSSAGVDTLVALVGGAQSPFLPSQWLASGVMAAAGGDLGEAGFQLALLVSWAAMLAWLATHAAERWFFRGYSALAGGEGDAGPRRRGPLDRLEALLRPLPEPLRSLVAKDLRLFWRDPAQWGQFLVLFGLLALYVANLGSSGSGFADRETFRAVTTLLNMAAALLVLASLTTRFVFPLISLEGRRIWLLGLAPLSVRTLVFQKVGLSVVTTATLTLTLAAVSGVRLGLGGLDLTLSLVAVAAATVGLSGLAVGLGSLYPDFTADHPARIVSGLGGTLNFLLSMVYVLALVGGQAVVLLAHRLAPSLGPGAYRAWVAGAFVWIAAVTAVTAVVPLRLGLRHLRRIDY